MTDIISIIFLVLTALLLGSWYAVRTYKLLKADQQPVEVLEDVPEELLKNLAAKLTDKPAINIQFDTTAFSAALSKAAEAMAALGTAIGNSFELVMVSKQWYFLPPYLDWHDLWVGVYWKYEESELSDTFDELNIYVCIIPALVFRCYRQRKYQVVPKIDKRIDPVCLQCGLKHSLHPVAAYQDMVQCDGKFI